MQTIKQDEKFDCDCELGKCRGHCKASSGNSGLLCCPFCGEQPRYEPAAQGPNNEGSWPDQIIHKCWFMQTQILVRGHSKENVFDKWNTRAT